MNDSFLEKLPLTLRDAALGWLPESWRWLVQGLIAAVLVLAIFASLFALLTLVERKFLGRVQNRPGPNRTGLPYTARLPFLKFTEGKLFGLGQPMADGIKMLTKEDVVPRDADQILHFLAPVAMLAGVNDSIVGVPDVPSGSATEISSMVADVEVAKANVCVIPAVPATRLLMVQVSAVVGDGLNETGADTPESRGPLVALVVTADE